VRQTSTAPPKQSHVSCTSSSGASSWRAMCWPRRGSVGTPSRARQRITAFVRKCERSVSTSRSCGRRCVPPSWRHPSPFAKAAKARTMEGKRKAETWSLRAAQRESTRRQGARPSARVKRADARASAAAPSRRQSHRAPPMHQSLNEGVPRGLTYQTVNCTTFASSGGVGTGQQRSLRCSLSNVGTRGLRPARPRLAAPSGGEPGGVREAGDRVFLGSRAEEAGARDRGAQRERAELEAQRRKAEMELSAKNLLLRLQMVDAGANPAMIDQVFPLPRG